MTAKQLEEAMVALYGPNFRDKAIVSPMGVFFLEDSFAECGLEDPRAPLSPPYIGGLWQMTSHEQTEDQ